MRAADYPFVLPQHRAFYEAWAGARTGISLPDRQQFNPAKLGELAGVLNIIRITPDGARITFAGAETPSRMGIDLQGMKSADIYGARIAARFDEGLVQCLSQPCGFYLRYGCASHLHDPHAVGILGLPVEAFGERIFFTLPLRETDTSFERLGIDILRSMAWATNQQLDLGFGVPVTDLQHLF